MNVIRRVMSKKSESDSDYGCRSTLLRIIEDWKQALDKNRYVVAILMILSNLKAFVFTTRPAFSKSKKLRSFRQCCNTS